MKNVNRNQSTPLLRAICRCLCPLLLLPVFSPTPPHLDIIPDNISDYFDFDYQFTISDYAIAPDEAFSVYARAHTIVSMEMHSVILGLAAGTPVLHPRFAEAGRKAWMLRDLGIEQWLFDVDKEPSGKISAALLAIHEDYDAALGKVKSATSAVKRRQKETMDVVKQALAKP